MTDKKKPPTAVERGRKTVEVFAEQFDADPKEAVKAHDAGVAKYGKPNWVPSPTEPKLNVTSLSLVLLDWKPTADAINALPEPLRRYIHHIETDADPAGTVRENFHLRDENAALRKECERLAAEAIRIESELVDEVSSLELKTERLAALLHTARRWVVNAPGTAASNCAREIDAALPAGLP